MGFAGRLADLAGRAIVGPMPDSRKIVRHGFEVLAILAPLAGMTYFLFNPDAFNAFLDWLVRVL